MTDDGYGIRTFIVHPPKDTSIVLFYLVTFDIDEVLPTYILESPEGDYRSMFTAHYALSNEIDRRLRGAKYRLTNVTDLP